MISNSQPRLFFQKGKIYPNYKDKSYFSEKISAVVLSLQN
jgi:hypothetical protein